MRWLLLALCVWPAEGALYLSMQPDSTALGQLPSQTFFTVVPPNRWGQTTWKQNSGDPAAYAANGYPATDRLEISLVGVSTDIPNGKAAISPWAPFNQYPSVVPWTYTALDPLDTTSVFFLGLITSTPACLFSPSVAAGGTKLTLFVVECAVMRLQPGEALADMLTIHLPWPFSGTNPDLPQVVVTTQATFFLWDAGARTFASEGPVVVDTPWITTVPQLALSSLQFISIFPGDPARNLRITTVFNAPLEALTVTVQLGVQLQAGNTMTLSTSTISAPFQLRTTGSAGPAVPGVIWADPASLRADDPARFIAVGPTCDRRPGSVNCCSLSLGRISAPFVSSMSLPAWWVSFVITLGPAGCVLPADKRITFAIPRYYLGRNPPEVRQSRDGVLVPSMTHVAVDARFQTGSEVTPRIVQRFSDAFVVSWAANDNIGEPGYTLDKWVIPTDMSTTLGPSAWVVGLSTVAALRVSVDTVYSGLQPQAMEVSITLATGLAPRPNPDTDSWYRILLNSIQGVFRSNVGSVVSPLQLPVLQPAQCANALQALTTALGTLVITLPSDSCVAALSQANAILAFRVPSTMLLPNPAAGVRVTFDVRIFPSTDTRAGTATQRGAVTQVDTAALMDVLGYVTVADCGTLNYSPGTVGDIAAMSVAGRCQLVGSMVQISPVTAGLLQCPPNANPSNAQHMTTFVKVPEGAWSSAHWPLTNLPGAPSLSPQNVAMGGTPPISIAHWGIMYSTPMFGIVTSYPPTLANVRALGVAPPTAADLQVAFILRLDRVTTACSVPDEENPWTFCATTPLNIAGITLYPSTQAAAVALTAWGRRRDGAVCATVAQDGAVVGYATTAVSPSGGDGDSDGAWYAFFALFALPLLLALCALVAVLLFLRRRRRSPCPVAPPAVTQEVYWASQPLYSAHAPLSPAAYYNPATAYVPA